MRSLYNAASLIIISLDICLMLKETMTRVINIIEVGLSYPDMKIIIKVKFLYLGVPHLSVRRYEKILLEIKHVRIV